jgi:hypothetical protein
MAKLFEQTNFAIVNDFLINEGKIGVGKAYTGDISTPNFTFVTKAEKGDYVVLDEENSKDGNFVVKKFKETTNTGTHVFGLITTEPKFHGRFPKEDIETPTANDFRHAGVMHIMGPNNITGHLPLAKGSTTDDVKPNDQLLIVYVGEGTATKATGAYSYAVKKVTTGGQFRALNIASAPDQEMVNFIPGNGSSNTPVPVNNNVTLKNQSAILNEDTLTVKGKFINTDTQEPLTNKDITLIYGDKSIMVATNMTGDFSGEFNGKIEHVLNVIVQYPDPLIIFLITISDKPVAEGVVGANLNVTVIDAVEELSSKTPVGFEYVRNMVGGIETKEFVRKTPI